MLMLMFWQVRGGNNPHSPEYYHPMVITDEPRGGFDRLTEAKQNEIRVLAGVEFTRRGRPKPTAGWFSFLFNILFFKRSVFHIKYWILAGPLCLGKHADTKDRRLDDNYPTFKKFNRTLRWTCESGDPAILEITPNTSWPDIVYYNSFTHANMGWKIHIVDSYRKNSGAFAMVPSNLVWATLTMIGCIFTLSV